MSSGARHAPHIRSFARLRRGRTLTLLLNLDVLGGSSLYGSKLGEIYRLAQAAEDLHKNIGRVSGRTGR
jgi:hypothetical protein